MKYFELDKEEKKVLADFDKGDMVSIKKLKSEKAKYQNYAKLTLGKSKNINIRLSEKDLQKIKSKAVSKGLPYQTLLSSLIHQYADEQTKNKVCF
ncbi:MAG: hypothetical protein KAQ87_05325 [Candidatus Pacebacteria bacterium]|nr:hypothetical protein [Candidatus Paceibacterota bacterium]